MALATAVGAAAQGPHPVAPVVALARACGVDKGPRLRPRLCRPLLAVLLLAVLAVWVVAAVVVVARTPTGPKPVSGASSTA